jgi:pimeloyl-ACP methyl ester carboxylesterase
LAGGAYRAGQAEDSPALGVFPTSTVTDTELIARRESLGGDHPEMVEAGHDGRREDGIVAFSQTDFTDDLKKITVPVLVMHGRRSDRSLCRRWTIVGKAAEERNVENLQGLPPRHADNAGGYDQCRPAGIHESLMLGPWYGR